MANSEEKPIFMHHNSTSKYQHIQGDQLDVEDDQVWGKGCNWLSHFCFRSCGQGNDNNETDTETWWKYKLKKLKELSEKVAGPKWKNFIRKMSGYFHKRKNQNNGFQYDPYSYALNFDNGADSEDYHLLQASSRFAAPFADERQRT